MDKDIKTMNLEMPMFVLRGLTVFPKMVLFFDISRERSSHALEDVLRGEQTVFLAAQREPSEDEPPLDRVYEVGTVSRVCQIFRLPDDTLRVLVEGLYRAKRTEVSGESPVYHAEVERIDDRSSNRVSATRVEALVRRVRDAFEEYAHSTERISAEILSAIERESDPGYLADYVAQNMPVSIDQKQQILEEQRVIKRLEKAAVMLSGECEIVRLEQSIQQRVRQQVGRSHREFYLREQLHIIREELGEEPESEGSGEYRDRIRSLEISDEYIEKLLKEVERLDMMHPSTQEAAVVRTYLDTVLELPWGKSTKDRTDLGRAAKILDKKHYGLEKVKERILEFLAVRKLKPDIGGQVICLVGPPGVGKTSVAMSIAEAMGRKTARLSLGGVQDEAEIRGHRKTYVGAMPGRIMNALGQAGSKNAVLILDEVDKLGHDFRGDPSAALLEVLDTEQNHAFRDHYIEIPFDLSQVLFITTANTVDTIPRPLLDRMEVIELSSYTDEEKIKIATRHLLPKQLEKHGLSSKTMKLSVGAIRELIECYTRESGVRNLEREISSLCRKAAKTIAEGGSDCVHIAARDIEPMLGPHRYKPERRTGHDEVGVVCGLAWTSVGGEILETEVGIVPGSGKVELTGNLGDVMKESARAAITYIRSVADKLGIDPDFHKNRDIHIHFPEGAIPKDGPSAGVTIATAICSALLEAPVRSDVAMTGEITLRGRVLPIGGLREKTMAAYRNGIRTVIIPAENESDLAEIDKTVCSELNFVTVKDTLAVFRTAINFSAAKKSEVKSVDKPA